MYVEKEIDSERKKHEHDTKRINKKKPVRGKTKKNRYDNREYMGVITTDIIPSRAKMTTNLSEKYLKG